MSQDPDFQNLLAGLSVDPRGDQTPSASGAGRGGGGIAGTAGAPLSQDEGTYLSEIEGQVYSVHDSIQSSVSFQASAFRGDQAPRSVHVSSMSLEQVISPVESMSDPPSSKRYRVVQIALDPGIFGRYCFTTIGQGPCVCVAVDCETSHQGGKLKNAIEPGDLMVLKGGTSAFHEPRIPGSALSQEVTSSWLGDSRSLKRWNSAFAVAISVELMEDEEPERKPATHAAISAKEEFAEQAKSFRTPVKRKMAVMDEIAFLAFTPHKKQALATDTLVGLSDDDMIAKVISFFNNVDTSLADTAEILMSFMANYELSFKDLARGLKSLELRVSEIRDELGNPSAGLSEEFASPTAWGTISSIASKLGDLEGNVISASELRTSIQSSESRALATFNPKIEALNLKQFKLSSDVRELMLRSSTTPLDAKVQEVKATLLSAAGLLNNKISAESFRIDLLEQSNRHLTAPVHNPQADGSENLNAGLVERIEERVNMMEVELSRVAASNDDQAIKFASLGFRRSAEATAWWTTHCPSNEYGLFVDPHMVLEHIHYNIHGANSLTQLEKLYKLKIETIGQGIALQSFESSVPKLFNGTGYKLVLNDLSFFDKIPSFAEWDERDVGWKNKLKLELQNFSVAHARTITEEFDSDSKMYNIARLALTESVAWVSGFLGFIDDYYEELTQGKFGTKKGWHVTTRLAKRLIEEVAVPRSAVLKSIKAGNPQHIARTLFWASLQSMDICAGIKGNNFKNDPLVSSELVKFLAVNTGFESIDKLQREVTELKEKVLASAKAVNLAEKSAFSAANKADDLKKFCDTLVKRITTLEKK
jgi:hypothetical protein